MNELNDLEKFLIANLKMVMAKRVDKLEATFEKGSIKIYWCGTVVRIDVKPHPAGEGV